MGRARSSDDPAAPVARVTPAAGAPAGPGAAAGSGAAAASVWLPPARTSIVLPPEPGSPSRARALLREVLTATGRLDVLDVAELACTELVTNAVLHAHTPVEVTVEVAGQVRVMVRDGSPVLPGRRRYDPHATTGRGLALVAALTDEHGVAEAGPDGKTVWFTVGAGTPERTERELLVAWSADDGAPAVGSPTDASTRRTVRLLQMPSALWLAARQHHDALLRELALYSARHADVAVDMAAADRARFTLSGAVAASVEEQRRAAGADADEVPGTLPWAPAPVDLVLEIPAGMSRDFASLQDTLDTAERLAGSGRLLARPGLPEIVAVRDWACDQVVAQLSGVAPSPWPGMTDDTSRTASPADAGTSADRHDPLGLDLRSVREHERAVAVADDTNRLVAVSATLARLVGRTPEDLVGRRIVALIPERLREAHVAGFTRHQSTGEAHVLGVPLRVPVLRADGSEVERRLLLEERVVATGRSLYLAWLDPVDEGTTG